uniref:Sulfatase-modifying factor enzyme-like domain-containing protein n=1 Tax=Magnetococcus massalia (strain MO-1) TaxID=451514 RepID=A0A1S7LPS7_MAGMO|nr:conserved exported protein of unknown function [Candidatus Magnetococcus massalia]
MNRRWFTTPLLAMAALLLSSQAGADLVNTWEPIDTTTRQAQPAEKVTPGQSWRDPMSGMQMVWVERGCYRMGSAPRIEGRGGDEGPVHDVCVSGYWIAQTEMTQGQWRQIMRNNPSKQRRGDDYPVEQVAWDDVEMFLSRINAFYKGRIAFRLPTEAEWEFACRNRGGRSQYAGGNNAAQSGWLAANSGGFPRKVGERKPNRLGLLDMNGNVWEWTLDAYSASSYANSPRQDPMHENILPYRVIRGGGFASNASQLRCSNRGFEHFTTQSPRIGLRLVAVVASKEEKRPMDLQDILF